MENEFIREIEINGIKVEVDLRTCKRIDTFKIGDNVKVLKNNMEKNTRYTAALLLIL